MMMSSRAQRDPGVLLQPRGDREVPLGVDGDHLDGGRAARRVQRRDVDLGTGLCHPGDLRDRLDAGPVEEERGRLPGQEDGLPRVRVPGRSNEDVGAHPRDPGIQALLRSAHQVLGREEGRGDDRAGEDRGQAPERPVPHVLPHKPEEPELRCAAHLSAPVIGHDESGTTCPADGARNGPDGLCRCVVRRFSRGLFCSHLEGTVSQPFIAH